METRREFLKKAALLSGAGAVWGFFPESIQKALAIDPEQGSTYLDAEYVVILMQENRSFDHCYGTLQGVRGFNDPRAHVQPNLNPVWLQTNPAGETYAPFRLKMKETNATWMGSLPHSWTNQVDARNNGHYDKWLQAKPSGHRDYARMPLTLGYYSREDIPFYYAFADAFTVCDQHFCSSLTGTTPNRLFLWTGTVRETPDGTSFANVRNEEVDYGREAKWTTFPERLEDLGVSWKIYQNEISLDSGFKGEEDSWLSNFTDNPIEWFTQYNVRYATGHRNHLDRLAKTLPQDSPQLKDVLAERERWSQANFDKLSQREKNLHAKAFSTNEGDPNYRKLDSLIYTDEGKERTVQVPKGDILYQFREDVNNGKLPAVSWIVGPENFSDHPGAAWYGAWYVSEVLDILTANPEVWKKTIFILTYDENDGYFDHVPPFVAPNPKKPETGLCSKGIDTAVEFVELEQDLKRKPAAEARESAVGLGYRVPLVVASPWSRGGAVNSQVFDHTSPLQFLETWLTKKTGKKVVESNISPWRRTVCGDLTSIFQPYQGEKTEIPSFPTRDEFIETIHKARFKKVPDGYKGLTAEDIAAIKKHEDHPLMPAQEKGTRKSSPLPYELYVDGALGADGKTFTVKMEARNNVFGKKAAGSPFNGYSYGKEMHARSYAVAAGASVSDTWNVSDGAYNIVVDGPNGFQRRFTGASNDPALDIQFQYAGGKIPNGKLDLKIVNRSAKKQTVKVVDNAYGSAAKSVEVTANGQATLTLETKSSGGWYDLTLSVSGANGFRRDYAGRVETGQWSISDPAMGRVV